MLRVGGFTAATIATSMLVGSLMAGGGPAGRLLDERAAGREPAGSLAQAQALDDSAFALPAPSGDFLVGTRILHLADAQRITPVGGSPRPLTVQLWYPAAAPTEQVGPYVWEPGVRAALRDGYYELTADRIERWGHMSTAAYVDAPAAPGSHPLVMLSHGLGVIRANYTLLAQQLASRGWMVAAVDDPFGGITVTGDGELLHLADDSSFVDDEAYVVALEREWGADLVYVADWLGAAHASAPALPSVDAARIGAIGHSLGGAAAFEACRQSVAFAACVNLDGFSLGAVTTAGVGAAARLVKAVPIYSDEDHARRGRTREQWDEMVRTTRPALEAPLRHRSSAPSFLVEIHGTGHMSFTDAPFVMPDTITRFGGETLTANRTFHVVTGIVVTFLEAVLSNGDPSAVLALASSLPEVAARQLAHRPE